MNRLFSGIRAAVSFGRAAPRQAEAQQPARQPAAPNRDAAARAWSELAAAQEQVRTSHQERHRAEVEQFERDCKRAQSVLGDRPEAHALIALLQDIGGAGAPTPNWDAVHKQLRAEPDARRGCYFD